MKLIALALVSLLAVVGSAASLRKPKSFDVSVYSFEVTRPSEYHEYAFQVPLGGGDYPYTGPKQSSFNARLGCWRDEHSDTAGCKDIKKAVFRPASGKCQKGMRVGYDSRLNGWEDWALFHGTSEPYSLTDYGLTQRDNWGWEEAGTVYKKQGYQHKEWDQAYDEATMTWNNVEPPRIYDVFFYYRQSDDALVFTEKRQSSTHSYVNYFEGGLIEAGIEKALETFFDYLPQDACDFAYERNPELEQGGAEDATIEIYAEAILEKYGQKRRGKLTLDESQMARYLEEVSAGAKVEVGKVMKEVDGNKDKLIDKVELEDYIDSLNLV
jgi:hypothetical protein